MINHPNRTRRYAVARAAGWFGDTTPVVSMHTQFEAALAARGKAGPDGVSEFAVYVVDTDYEVGQTLYADMLPLRVDREPRDLPRDEPFSAPYRGDGGWFVTEDRGRYVWDEDEREGYYADAQHGPFASQGKAQRVADKGNREWRREWLATPAT